ncbi:MAG: type VI secretion system tip protein VgrG [Deltaproteobacteria bacterium]|nr:type VI secretion system tip protein VgrG [Deltaproteobacteria bacterium]
MTEHASLAIAGADHEVVSVDGEEAVSDLYRVQVVCRIAAGQPPPSPKALAGAEASLQLSDGREASRPIAGVVTTARTAIHDDGSVILQVVLRPAAYLLTLGRGCRAYQEMTVVDIVTQVLGGLAHRWEVGGAFATREYTVQYREDDWRFCCRLLEEEGIYYWFDHAAGSLLVLSDTSPGAADLPGGALIEYHADTGMEPDREVIDELGGVARVVPTAFAVKSFNPANPGLDVSGSTGSGKLEIYDAPGGGPISPEAAARQAQLKSGAAGAAAAGIAGRCNSVRPCPGRVLEVAGHGSLDGAYFTTQVGYQVRQRRRGAEAEVERAYQCTFAGVAKATPFVPPRVTPPAQQAGIQSGTVGGPPGEEIYPDEAGQVRVQQHWDLEGTGDDKSGTWMRVAQRGTHDSMQLPRIGWNVLTFNEEGAVDAPNVLARVNDGEHPPAYPLPANKTRVVFKTATSPADGSFNEIYFEDSKGSEEMFVNASRDLNVLVQHNQTEGIDHDSLRTVGNDHDLLVVSDVYEKVLNDQTVSIGANEQLSVGGSGVDTVGGNLTVSIGGNRKLEVGDDCTRAVKGTHCSNVGAARIDTCLGSISASGNIFTLTTGAAILKLAAQSVSDSCGGVSVQTIGGAKLQFTQGDRPVDVQEHLLETVGGLMMLKTDGAYVDTATKTSKWTAGALLHTEAKGSTLVEAGKKITIKCGGSSVTIEPETITFKAKKLVLDGDMVHVETECIEHN